jgi:mannose-1-phosphate guanylyltransferase
MRPVIICGGIGTKLWPLSRQSSPKQFLPLIKGKSLFELTFQSLKTRFRPDQIYVQTTADQVLLARRQAPLIPLKNYFIEPEMRNHGPAMGLMAAKLFKKDPDDPFILVQVDVIRTPAKNFIKMIDRIDRLIKKEKKLVTGGIRPDYIVMGVDYLIPGEKIKNTGSVDIYKMKKWLWRTSREKTISSVKKGSVFVHANHYAWTPRLFLDSYRRRRPDWYIPLQKMIKSFDTPRESAVIKREYTKMPKGPVEEVSRFELENGYVVELPFRWIDIGTWESLNKHYQDTGLYKEPPLFTSLDSQNNFVYQANKKKIVGLVGVNNLAIVDTPDALLVCRLDQSGRVGEIVTKLPLDSTAKP